MIKWRSLAVFSQAVDRNHLTMEWFTRSVAYTASAQLFQVEQSSPSETFVAKANKSEQTKGSCKCGSIQPIMVPQIF